MPSNEPSTATKSPIVPSWLEVPPTSAIDPPVETRKQLLPVRSLNWDDFERLCLRLVRLEADVEECRIYGQRGQAQHGIDLFARNKHDDRYGVYQCKKVGTFERGEVVEAVDKFLSGSWSRRSNKFNLCVSADLSRTEIAEEVEIQAKRLRSSGIVLNAWGVDEISLRLKDIPELVDDFFGRTWAVGFCGKSAADRLKTRLDGRQVTEFRQRLGELYARVFGENDPGIAIPPLPGQGRIPLGKRFVLPDVLINPLQRQLAPSGARGVVGDVELGDFSSASSIQAVDAQRRSREHHSLRQLGVRFAHSARERIGTWLPRKDWSIIVGGPGSGKSTLLRFLILDLLSNEPTLSDVAARHGSRLPIWIPFGFWTRLISEGGEAEPSLGTCVKRWLERWDRGDLWPLVASAIDDERLLLLVDGLDEGVTEESGRVAGQNLQVFAQDRKVVLIATTRPAGLHTVALQGEEWQSAELARLSPSQQAELVEKWFSIRAIIDSGDAQLSDRTSRQIRADVDRFREELSSVKDLAELAKIPLLLVLLIYTRFQHHRLPDGRFQAYELVVEHLLVRHLSAKRAAALMPRRPETLSDSEVKAVLAGLAFAIHRDHPDGTITDEGAERVVDKLLAGIGPVGFGLNASETRKYRNEFLAVSEETVGLLVRQGAAEISVFHRSLQDYLAGRHVSRLPIADQVSIFRAHCADRRWHEVLLSGVWNTTRSEDVDRLVSAISAHPIQRQNAVSELRAELALGGFNMSAQLTRTIAEEIFERIEHGDQMPVRERLVGHVMKGVRNTGARELIARKIVRWSDPRSARQPWSFQSLSNWPPTNQTLSILWTALHREDRYVQRAAAQALAVVAKGMSAIADRLVALAEHSQIPARRAAALDCLARGWPNEPRLTGLTSLSRRSPSREVRLAAIRPRINLGHADDRDLDELIELAEDRYDFQLGAWSDDVPDLLISGWSRSERLKRACLEATQRGPSASGIDLGIAVSVLLRGFPHDPEVAEYCAREIAVEQHPFLMAPHILAWRWLAESFRDDPVVAAAIEAWAPGQKFREPEVSFAALVSRSPSMKATLLERTADPETSFPHWLASALMEGWGADDLEVKGKLTNIVLGEPHLASRIAHLIPRIIRDSREARERLISLLDAPGGIRLDLVIAGFSVLQERGDEQEIVDLALAAIDKRRPLSFMSEEAENALILAFPQLPPIRALAIQALSRREPLLSAVAYAYAADDDMRSLVAERMQSLDRPLRAVILREINSAASGGELTQSILRDYDAEDDDELKTLGSIGYHRWLMEKSGDCTQRVAELKAVFQEGGLDYDKRHRAAFAGLVALGQTQAIDDGRGLGNRRLSVSLGYLSQNAPLLTLVGENWATLRETFGDELPARLSEGMISGNVNPAHFWQEFCSIAADFPQTHSDVLKELDQHRGLSLHPNALRFLSELRPRSRMLRDRCIDALVNISVDNLASMEACASVAETFAINFADDDIAIDLLRARSRGILSDTGLVIALCLARPDDPMLSELYQLIRRDAHAHGMSYPAFHALTYTKVPTPELVDQLTSDLKRGEVRPWPAHRLLVGP